MGTGAKYPGWRGVALLPWFRCGEAPAANNAYAVEAADISEAGSCKFESWMSFATNADFSVVANPSCVVDPFKRVELSLLTNRAQSDGEWGTSIAPKAKMKFADRRRKARICRPPAARLMPRPARA